MPGTCWGPDTEISIGDYNGGEFYPGQRIFDVCAGKGLLMFENSCFGFLRLGACQSADCFHVEFADEHQAQSGHLRFDGNGFLVSYPPQLGMLR